MAQHVIKMNNKERAALAWLYGSNTQHPPNYSTLLDLCAVGLVTFHVDDTVPLRGVTVRLTNAGLEEAAKPAPVKRARKAAAK